MANASLPQLSYRWDEAGLLCSSYMGGLHASPAVAIVAPHILHVLWLPSLVTLSSRIVISPAVAAVAALCVLAAMLLVCLRASSGAFAFASKAGMLWTPLMTFSRSPVIVTASACANLVIAAALTILVTALAATGSTSFVVIVWCVMHTCSNVCALTQLCRLRLSRAATPPLVRLSARGVMLQVAQYTLGAVISVLCAFSVTSLTYEAAAGATVTPQTIAASTAAVARASALATQTVSIHTDDADSFVLRSPRPGVADLVNRAMTRQPMLDAVLRAAATIRLARYLDMFQLMLAFLSTGMLWVLWNDVSICSGICVTWHTVAALTLAVTVATLTLHVLLLAADSAAARARSMNPRREPLLAAGDDQQSTDDDGVQVDTLSTPRAILSARLRLFMQGSRNASVSLAPGMSVEGDPGADATSGGPSEWPRPSVELVGVHDEQAGARGEIIRLQRGDPRVAWVQ